MVSIIEFQLLWAPGPGTFDCSDGGDVLDLVVLCSVGYFFQGIFHKYFVGYFFPEIFLTRMFFCCGTSKLVVFALVSVTDEFTLVFNLDNIDG